MLKRFLHSRVVLVALLSALTFTTVLVVDNMSHARLPNDDRGYEPVQPIAFSHRLHAGEMSIACVYCHDGVTKSRHAGVPAANTCMNCHRFVNAAFLDVKAEEKLAEKEGRRPGNVVSPELRKLYDALGLNDKLERDETKPRKPIEWVKVHDLPDYVYFDHRPHVAAGVACQRCHGAVENMERVRQVADLSMGWCLTCHRDVKEFRFAHREARSRTDCVSCHY